MAQGDCDTDQVGPTEAIRRVTARTTTAIQADNGPDDVDNDGDGYKNGTDLNGDGVAVV